MNNGYQPKGSVGNPQDPPRHPNAGLQQERNFCSRCGKRLAKDGVHTCSQPRTDAPDSEQQAPVGFWNGKEKAWFEHELCGHAAPDGCIIPIYTHPLTTAQAARQMRDAAVAFAAQYAQAAEDAYEQSGSRFDDGEANAARGIEEAIAAMPVPEAKVCNWTQPRYDDAEQGAWKTDCDNYWYIIDGTPSDNNMKFCHGCGRQIVEHQYAEAGEEK